MKKETKDEWLERLWSPWKKHRAECQMCEEHYKRVSKNPACETGAEIKREIFAQKLPRRFQPTG